MQTYEIGTICADPDFRAELREPRELSRKKRMRLREQVGGNATSKQLSGLADKFAKPRPERTKADKQDVRPNPALEAPVTQTGVNWDKQDGIVLNRPMPPKKDKGGKKGKKGKKD